MSRPTIVLFDMDGVLADFVGGSLAVHGKTLPPADVGWDFMAQVGFAGGGDPAFWEPLCDPAFWAGLAPLADGMCLFERVAAAVPRERIGFLSSGLCPGSADGKRAWLKTHLPGWERNLILGNNKSMVAAPCKLLVDDHGPNVDGFRGFGGRAVLVPRPWNDRKPETCGRGLFDVERVAWEVLAGV